MSETVAIDLHVDYSRECGARLPIEGKPRVPSIMLYGSSSLGQ